MQQLQQSNNHNNNPRPGALEIATAVAFADCNLWLAAERLQKVYANVNPNLTIDHEYIISTLASDQAAQDSLIGQLKLKAMLDGYGMVKLITEMVRATITEYEPKDQLKALSIYTTLFGQMTTEVNNLTINNMGGNSFNVYDKMLALLPLDVRDAVKQLVDDNANNNDPTNADNLPVQIITHRSKKQQRLLEEQTGTDNNER